MRRTARLAGGWIVAMVMCLTANAQAEWIAGGVPLCTETNLQVWVHGIDDGAGGAIFTWTDFRELPVEAMYAQRVDAAGVVQWTAGGARFCRQDGCGSSPQTVSDNAGGAIVVWSDSRTDLLGDIYARRIDASGTALWQARGIPICRVDGYQYDPDLVEDGNGGAIIVWDDRRVGSQLYGQRVDASGNVQWATNGAFLGNISTSAVFPRAIPDGAGGAIIAVSSLGLLEGTGLVVHRIDGAGNPLWTSPTGEVVGKVEFLGFVPAHQIVPDGFGGAIVAWQDRQAGDDTDIYAQRLDADGTLLWAAQSAPVCTAAGVQMSVQLMPDGTGGAFLVWADARSGSPRVYAQRVDGAGLPIWAADGVAICSAAGGQTLPQLVADGEGGILVAWNDARNGGRDQFAQRLDGSGALLWATEGVAICATPDSTDHYAEPVAMVGHGTFGAMLAWNDARAGEWVNDVYASRILPSGAVPSIVIDGVADADYGASRAVQAVQTDFGDNNLGTLDSANGSELDQAFGLIRDGMLHLVLAGNLESNANHLEVFLDSAPGGQNRLRGDNPNVSTDGLNRMGDDGSGNGLTFDAGFEADWYLTVACTPSALWADWAAILTDGGGYGNYLGEGSAGSAGVLSGPGGWNPFGIRVTLDNSNTAGVTAGTGPSSGAGVTTGVEIAIPLAALGSPAGEIQVCAFVNSAAHDYLSNQVLGPLAPGSRLGVRSGNLGEPRAVNFAMLPGSQTFPTAGAGGVAVPILAPVPASWLGPVVPNPFRSNPRVEFETPADGWVRLDVHDVAGRKVTTLVDLFLPAGRHTATLPSDGIASGVYFVCLEAAGIRETRKVSLVR